MALALNRTRVRDSWLVALLSLVLFLMGAPLAVDESSLHEVLDFIGYLLIATCALGRVYTTAFLGGHKNTALITYGPFSVVRNPLYCFSLMGITGIALASMRLSVMIIAPVMIATIYYYLVRREEGFLRESFGAEYDAYTANVPRFIPALSHYQAPPQVPMCPDRLLAGVKDAIWWFLPLPLFELLEAFGL